MCHIHILCKPGCSHQQYLSINIFVMRWLLRGWCIHVCMSSFFSCIQKALLDFWRENASTRCWQLNIADTQWPAHTHLSRVETILKEKLVFLRLWVLSPTKTFAFSYSTNQSGFKVKGWSVWNYRDVDVKNPAHSSAALSRWAEDSHLLLRIPFFLPLPSSPVAA